MVMSFYRRPASGLDEIDSQAIEAGNITVDD
jgi:hypothetical protein